jgi:hypothetical protein
MTTHIYKIIDYDNNLVGLYKTTKTLEEKKEELINNLINNKKPVILLESIDNYKNYCFDLILVKDVEENVEEEFLKLQEEHRKIKMNETAIKIGTPNINFRRLKFNNQWTTYSRPTILTSKSNKMIIELSKELGININETVRIIKEFSLFALENIKYKKCTRIPFIGAFKIKKTKVAEHLNDEAYGTSNSRRRRKYRAEQDLAKINSSI